MPILISQTLSLDLQQFLVRNITNHTVTIAINLYIPSGNILLLETLIKYKTKNTSTKLVNILFNNLNENKVL